MIITPFLGLAITGFVAFAVTLFAVSLWSKAKPEPRKAPTVTAAVRPEPPAHGKAA